MMENKGVHTQELKWDLAGAGTLVSGVAVQHAENNQTVIT